MATLRVLPRLRHRHGLDNQEIDDLVDILSFQAERVEPYAVAADAIRDIDDLPVLGTFLAAQDMYAADYLVTGDKDLLSEAGKFSIITPAAFWVAHGV